MDNNTFKSVAFGGFDKQDVIAYIEKTARETAAAREALEQENAKLRQELEAQASQLATLRYQLETLRAEHAQAREALAAETAAQAELETLRSQMEQMKAEKEALRTDAEGYVRLRERVGAIECEARQRAADLEDATQRRLEGTAQRFRVQYQALMETFEAAAAHVNGELRKIEVNLTQLPRVLDQSGAQLERLEALLEDSPEEQTPPAT